MKNTPNIDASTSVREIMQKFPSTRKIFDEYGLLGCGGPEGPTEPVSLFARVHQMNLEELLDRIREAAADAETRLAGGSPSPASDSLLPLDSASAPVPADSRGWPRIFVRTASLAFVAVGTLTGAIYLSIISYYGTHDIEKFWPGWTAHVQSHAHVQVSGWVTLFIMGIALFALPRFLAVSLPEKSTAQAVYWLMLAGIVLRVLYQPFSAERWAANMVVWGAIAEFAAAIVFLRFVLRAIRSSAKSHEPYTDYLKWGTIWLVVSQAILLIHAAAALVAGREVILSRPTDEAYLHTMLMGFVGLFILGVTLRTVPLMLDFARVAGEKLQGLILTAWNLGVWMFAVGQLSRLGTASGTGWVLAGASFELLAGLAFLVAVNPFQKPRASRQDESSPVWIGLMRAAYLWFAVALGMGLILAAWPAATGIAAAQPYWGAFRHALTVGWISMMIFGMAYRMVPVMEGKSLRLAWTAPAVFWLANVGTLGRVGLQSLGVSLPGALPWMAPTGFMELTAGILFTLAIWKTASALPAQQTPERMTEQATAPGTIGPDMVVGKVLNAFPDSLEVFVRHGFTALNNPVLRAAAANLVTISQACRMHGIAQESLLRDLHSLSKPERRTEYSATKAAGQVDLVQTAAVPQTVASPSRARKLEEDVWSVLQSLEDPEFPGISIVDLGLVYNVIAQNPEEAAVQMTLTSRGCPSSKAITDAVRKRVEYKTSAQCHVELVWEPAWTPDRITPAGRALLGYSQGAGKPS